MRDSRARSTAAAPSHQRSSAMPTLGRKRNSMWHLRKYFALAHHPSAEPDGTLRDRNERLDLVAPFFKSPCIEAVVASYQP